MPVWELIEFNSWQKYSTRFSTYVFSKRKELFSLPLCSLFSISLGIYDVTFLYNRYILAYTYIYIAFNTKNTNRSEYHGKCSSFEQYRAMLAGKLSTEFLEERGGSSIRGSSLCSKDTSRPTYNHHNAFNVKRWRRSDTWVWPGLWIYGKWQRLETVHGDRFGRQFVYRDLIHAPVARIEH